MQDFAEYASGYIGFSLRTLQRFFAHSVVKAFDRKDRKELPESSQRKAKSSRLRFL
jgi:hypothetical protein